jgi:hypothetical protein
MCPSLGVGLKLTYLVGWTGTALSISIGTLIWFLPAQVTVTGPYAFTIGYLVTAMNVLWVVGWIACGVCGVIAIRKDDPVAGVFVWAAILSFTSALLSALR